MKEEAWSAIQEAWKRQEEGWKSKEEAWKMMEETWKSNSSKTEMQAVLPPLVLDALVQTDSVTRQNEFCQTVQSDGVDLQIQVSMQPERKMVSTQTMKEEYGEIALPNIPSSSSSKETKKRKLSSIQTVPYNGKHPDGETPCSSCSGSNAEKPNDVVTQNNNKINGDHPTKNRGPKIGENGNIVMQDDFQHLDVVWAKCSGIMYKSSYMRRFQTKYKILMIYFRLSVVSSINIGC